MIIIKQLNFLLLFLTGQYFNKYFSIGGSKSTRNTTNNTDAQNHSQAIDAVGGTIVTLRGDDSTYHEIDNGAVDSAIGLIETNTDKFLDTLEGVFKGATSFVKDSAANSTLSSAKALGNAGVIANNAINQQNQALNNSSIELQDDKAKYILFALLLGGGLYAYKTYA